MNKHRIRIFIRRKNAIRTINRPICWLENRIQDLHKFYDIKIHFY